MNERIRELIKASLPKESAFLARLFPSYAPATKSRATEPSLIFVESLM